MAILNEFVYLRKMYTLKSPLRLYVSVLIVLLSTVFCICAMQLLIEGKANKFAFPSIARAVQEQPTVLQQQLVQVAVSHSRGYLTTPEELTLIAQKAKQGIEPYHSAVSEVIDWANRKWDYRLDTKESCEGADQPAWLNEQKGTPRLYARALAYHLTGKQKYAKEAVEILQKIMKEVKVIDLEEQQCRLNFGWGTPELVATADLIEEYWQDKSCTGPTSTLYHDMSMGVGNCKTLFQNWLVKNPYYVVSYAAIHSNSNWGAAATNTTAYIADYLWDRPDILLRHRSPKQVNNGRDLFLTPHQAYLHANELMFERMNGYQIEYGSSRSCDYLSGAQQNTQWIPVKSQINENGIIPEDARREEYCNVPQYNGEYQNYPQIHIGNNIQQCELMLRRGDSRCFDNVDTTDLPNYTFKDPKGIERTTHLYPGRGSIERAIKAIIVDSRTEWKHDSALEVAYHYYYTNHTLSGFEKWSKQLDDANICSQSVCFGKLTHGFALDETPTQPPTTSPP